MNPWIRKSLFVCLPTLIVGAFFLGFGGYAHSIDVAPFVQSTCSVTKYWTIRADQQISCYYCGSCSNYTAYIAYSELTTNGVSFVSDSMSSCGYSIDNSLANANERFPIGSTVTCFLIGGNLPPVKFSLPSLAIYWVVGTILVSMALTMGVWFVIQYRRERNTLVQNY